MTCAREPRWTPLALIAGLGVIVPAALTWAYAVDDAWIVARYARRLLDGRGYTFVDGAPTDGITGPLGLLPALLGAIFDAPLEGAKAAGVLAAVLAAVGVTALARREGRAHASATAIWIAATPLVGVWAAAGLETGLATLAFTALAGGASLGRGALVGGATLALAWLRPETAPAALVALGLLWRGGAGEDEPSRLRTRRFRLAVGLAVLGAASIVVFRLALFGSPLPLSAVAKPPDLGHGFGYVGRALVILFGGFGAIVVGFGARDPVRRPAAWVLLALVLSLVLAGGDWMPGFRLLVIAVPTAAWVAAGFVGPRLKGWGALALVSSLALPLLAGGLSVVEAQASAASRDGVGRELATFLEGRRVAAVDVGYLGYASHAPMFDLAGVTDPAIARLPGGHAAKSIDPGALEAWGPTAIVLHSTVPPRVHEDTLLDVAGHPVERRVASMAWVRARMRIARIDEYAPAYWYVTLVPRDGTLTP